MANVFVIAIWCMVTHGICVIPLNIMQSVQVIQTEITYTTCGT